MVGTAALPESVGVRGDQPLGGGPGDRAGPEDGSQYLSAPGPATPPRRSPNGRSKARVIDEFAPLVDSMLRAEILMKAAVIHGRLTAEYGFTGNYQRVKLYV